MKAKAVFATKIGEPGWKEQLITLITDHPARTKPAIEWARRNGFDRIRVVVLDLSTPHSAAAVKCGSTLKRGRRRLFTRDRRTKEHGKMD